jgi:hypothetical protein
VIRATALVLAFSLLGADRDPSTAVRYFLGSWRCAEIPVSFEPLVAGSSWTRVEYGDESNRGTAIVGYVASLGGYVFRDFRADGAYAEMVSPGPSDGRWQWTGPYYPQEGGPALSGRVTYTEISPTHFDRRFELLRDQEFVPAGNDSCRKIAS